MFVRITDLSFSLVTCCLLSPRKKLTPVFAIQSDAVPGWCRHECRQHLDEDSRRSAGLHAPSQEPGNEELAENDDLQSRAPQTDMQVQAGPSLHPTMQHKRWQPRIHAQKKTINFSVLLCQTRFYDWWSIFRFAVRRCLGYGVSYKIHCLPLPTKIKLYLDLCDLDDLWVSIEGRFLASSARTDEESSDTDSSDTETQSDHLTSSVVQSPSF